MICQGRSLVVVSVSSLSRSWLLSVVWKLKLRKLKTNSTTSKIRLIIFRFFWMLLRYRAMRIAGRMIIARDRGRISPMIMAILLGLLKNSLAKKLMHKKPAKILG